jgi:crotonobetainyl-CoA:carnitine CoA-transferase CaiB-like acyl-CoA transferase
VAPRRDHDELPAVRAEAIGHRRRIAREREAVVPVPDRGDGAIRIPNSPWHFSGAESGVRGQPAYRGEHNREVLAELCGLSGAELDQLEADEVLSSRVPTVR